MINVIIVNYINYAIRYRKNHQEIVSLERMKLDGKE